MIYGNVAPTILLEDRFLGIVVDAEETHATSLASDVRIQFLGNRVKVCSLLGCMTYSYPRGYVVHLNRPEAEPWWGAWQPIILGIVTVAVPLLLLSSWAVLAALYSPVVWLIAFFADRELTLGGSWRLASAALMPGAILVNAALVAYGMKAIDLVRLLTLLALHVVIGWGYVIASPFFLPRISVASLPPKKNPFATRGEEKTKQENPLPKD
jgi:hypothetical protein